uniref:Uncharacterized protein n=1 Tax=Arundo donax TaxID=35708 RepID=A0A0A9EI87_ARUDO
MHGCSRHHKLLKSNHGEPGNFRAASAEGEEREDQVQLLQ